MAPDREPPPSATLYDDAVEILTFDFTPGYARPRARPGLHFRAPKWADRDARRRWLTPSARQLALGLALAVVTGATIGLWAKPDLGAGRGAAPPPPRAPTDGGHQGRLSMAVRPPAALVPADTNSARTPQSTDTAPAVSEPMVETPQPMRTMLAAREPARPAMTGTIVASRAEPPAAPQPARRSQPDIQSAALPPPQARPLLELSDPPPQETYAEVEERPSFDCRYARSRAEDLVCADPDLARADRALERSYERALAFGVPRRILRDEQDDWLAIRESAARHSRRAVADVYRQRIEELNALADERVE